MIEYKYPEEKIISIFYAKKLRNDAALAILEKNSVNNSNEATIIAKFYWLMVAEVVSEKNNSIDNGFGNMDEWLEYICNTFFFYLSNNGYENEWDAE